jgi:hypothetical protein
MRCALPLILALAAGPALAQFKCTAADGSVSFQQQPCAAATRAERLVLPPAPPDDGRGWAQSLIAVGKIAPGMTRSEMVRAWGTPTKCNTSFVAGASHDQCIYRGPGGEDYVYLRNGIVESWQQSPH